MKDFIFLCGVIAAAVWVARQSAKQKTLQGGTVWDLPDAVKHDSLDDILLEILGNCAEAWCEDCSMVLATGTGPYKRQVEHVAYQHREMCDHEVHVRSWAD